MLLIFTHQPFVIIVVLPELPLISHIIILKDGLKIIIIILDQITLVPISAQISYSGTNGSATNQKHGEGSMNYTAFKEMADIYRK